MSDLTTRVLLVEDEEDAREILSFYLDTIFDEIEIASNGEEGVQKYIELHKKNKTFDLVLTDIRMPKKDGLEMIEDITSINENQKFIIVSAYKDEEYLFKSINLNVLSYFVKPLEVNNIMEILKKVKDKVLEDKKNISSVDNEVILNKDFIVNLQTKQLYNKDKELINLSKKETLLLLALVINIQDIKSKEYLKKKIWDDISASDATLRTLIKRVKDKISLNDFIVSKKGKGYMIERV